MDEVITVDAVDDAINKDDAVAEVMNALQQQYVNFHEYRTLS